MNELPFDSLHEECGVFGVFGVDDAPGIVYYGLHALQHRGQEACGIVSAEEGRLASVKGEGLVTEVFNGDNLSTLHGRMAIGHVRYSTAGGGGRENVQPFVFRHHTGDFALAHNGNLVNSRELVRYLEDKGSLFHSTSDSEILAHLIKKEHSSEHRIFAIIDALNMLEGGFAFLIMTENRLYACRDKYGLRPLSIGRLNDGWVVSSETCALDIVGAEFVRDVNPGEIVTLDRNGIRSRDYSMYKRNCMCAMEYIYFARPDSDIECCNVHAFRKESGRLLFEEAPADADVGVGGPGLRLFAPVPFKESQQIAVDHVDSGTKSASNLTVAKLRAALQLFEENEAWNQDAPQFGDQLVIAVTSSQIMNLLRETEVSSYDFNNVKALVEGKIDTFMGFKFIRTQRLPKTEEGVRSCLAWVKSKAQFGIWNDFKVKLSVRDDMEEALQIRAKFACGATRLQEEGFVKILCDEGAS